MVSQPVYFTSPDAFFPPEERNMTLADQLAGQGFLSPGVEGPGGQMFYGVAPEMSSLLGGTPDHMYAGESITPDFLRYMAQSWGGGSMSPDQLKQAFPEYLHSYMPQLDPTTNVNYKTYGVDEDTGVPLGQDHYEYTYRQPISAPQFQQLPSIDIQQQMDKQTEAETERAAAEAERERRPMLRSGAGRNVFGAGRT